jgi:hypothetical protein
MDVKRQRMQEWPSGRQLLGSKEPLITLKE